MTTDPTPRDWLAKCVEFHGHLCVGQPIGVLMALTGLARLELPAGGHPELMVFCEIDRCLADALQMVCGVRFGRRTLKVKPFGKLAATFHRLDTGRSVRVSLAGDPVKLAQEAFPETAGNDKAAQARVIDVAPERLLKVEEVRMEVPEDDRPGKPKRKTWCAECGEKILDGREVVREVAERGPRQGSATEAKTGPGQGTTKTLCRACAGEGYYRKG